MNVAGVLQSVAVVVIVLGVVLMVLGFAPATRAQVGDTLGWGVVLLVLGFVMLVVLLVVGTV